MTIANPVSNVKATLTPDEGWHTMDNRMISRRLGWILVGTILVASLGLSFTVRRIPKTPPAVAAAAEFRQLQARTPKAEQEALFARFLPKLGAERVLDILEATYPLCHSQAHPLGMAVFVQTRDVTAAIAACRDRCTNGCFHGILMAAFRTEQARAVVSPDDLEDEHLHVELDQLKSSVNKICSDPATQEIYRIGNCAHGVGHALSHLAGYRLDDALDACRIFPSRPLQFYCAGGVFMERDLVYGGHDAADASAYFPCDRHTEFPAACFRYKAKHLITRLGGLGPLASACQTLIGFQRLGCFHGLGFAHLDEVASSPDRLASVCRHGTADDQTVCIEGAIEKLADYNPERARAACDRLPDATRESCGAAIAWGIYSLDKPFTRYFPDPPASR